MVADIDSLDDDGNLCGPYDTLHSAKGLELPEWSYPFPAWSEWSFSRPI